nr:hypothetical protein [Tanacetum cinerariifolium]
ISLVQDEETSWIQEDYEIQGRTSADTKILLDQKEPTELVEDLGNSEKVEKEISTVIPEVHATAENLVYIKRSAEKRKDKGIAIMKEDKSVGRKVSEKKDNSSSKSVRASRKKTVAKKRIGAKLDEESAKRQKLEDVTEEEATVEYENENEKEELRLSLKIIHNDDSEINMLVEKKYPLIKELLEKMLNL